MPECRDAAPESDAELTDCDDRVPELDVRMQDLRAVVTEYGVTVQESGAEWTKFSCSATDCVSWVTGSDVATTEFGVLETGYAVQRTMLRDGVTEPCFTREGCRVRATNPRVGVQKGVVMATEPVVARTITRGAFRVPDDGNSIAFGR